MIHVLAKNYGWTVEYILWNLSTPQVFLLNQAESRLNKIMYKSKNEDLKVIDFANSPEDIFGGKYGN